MHSNDPKTPLTPHLLNFSSIVSRLLGGAMIAIMLLVLLTLVAPYIDDVNSFTYLRSALTFERRIEEAVRSNIPTRFGGKGIMKLMIIIGKLMFICTLSRAGEWFHRESVYIRNEVDLRT